MGDVTMGQSYTINDPKHWHTGVTVQVIGPRGVDGRYPVREPNGSSYLLTAEQLGVIETIEKEAYPEGLGGQHKKGKILRKFK